MNVRGRRPKKYLPLKLRAQINVPVARRKPRIPRPRRNVAERGTNVRMRNAQGSGRKSRKRSRGYVPAQVRFRTSATVIAHGTHRRLLASSS
jgi:hypothetical protein